MRKTTCRVCARPRWKRTVTLVSNRWPQRTFTTKVGPASISAQASAASNRPLRASFLNMGIASPASRPRRPRAWKTSADGDFQRIHQMGEAIFLRRIQAGQGDRRAQSYLDIVFFEQDAEGVGIDCGLGA